MIHYKLRCGAGHEFDGWFRDSSGFEGLAKAGLVECTICGSSEVERALMAPALVQKRRRARPSAPPPQEEFPAVAAPSETQRVAAGPMPAQVLALLQRLRAEVEKHCDYVGHAFADEARKIHNGESEPRGIYGEATEAEAEALAEDGIDVARLPWVPRADG
jgi:hypothetical protein